MAILEYFEGQTLATIRMTVPSTVDLNDAALVKIKYKKPNGFEGEWNATIEDTDAGTIVHEVQSRYEFDDTGWWFFWTFTRLNNGREMPGVPITVYIYEQGKRYLAFPYGRQPVIGGEEMPTNAFEIDYDNATSGLSADDVQEAIDELKNLLDAIEAGDIAYDNVASGLSSNNVQTVIDELLNVINAKTAEDFSYDPEHSGLYSTKVQTAIDEIVQEFNIDLEHCTFVSKSGQDTESMMSWQEFGLGVSGGDDSGLAASTTYYINVNGTQYSITTGATTPITYNDVVGLLDAALDADDFACTFETNDIRITNETVGVGEYVLIESSTTGPNLETSLTGFTEFDIPYYAELGVTRGTLQNPFLTVQAAIDSVTPTAGTYEMIFVLPGIYEEDLILEPWISIVGLDKSTTIVGKSTTGTNHAIDFPTGTGNMEIAIRNIGCYMDGFAVTHAAGSNAAILRLENVNIGDDFSVQFLGGGLDHLYMSNVIVAGLTTLDSAPIEYPNNVAFMGGLEISDTSNLNDDGDSKASSTIMRNCAIFDHLKQEGDTLLELRATHVQVTGVVKVTLDGADVEFRYDAVSAPLAHSDFIVQNGATRTPITRAKDIWLDTSSISGTTADNIQDALEELHP
jgi:hypothetical protein